MSWSRVFAARVYQVKALLAIWLLLVLEKWRGIMKTRHILLAV
jgi:hypothetical protein